VLVARDSSNPGLRFEARSSWQEGSVGITFQRRSIANDQRASFRFGPDTDQANDLLRDSGKTIHRDAYRTLPRSAKTPPWA